MMRTTTRKGTSRWGLFVSPSSKIHDELLKETASSSHRHDFAHHDFSAESRWVISERINLA